MYVYPILSPLLPQIPTVHGMKISTGPTSHGPRISPWERLLDQAPKFTTVGAVPSAAAVPQEEKAQADVVFDHQVSQEEVLQVRGRSSQDMVVLVVVACCWFAYVCLGLSCCLFLLVCFILFCCWHCCLHLLCFLISFLLDGLFFVIVAAALVVVIAISHYFG